MGTMIPGGLNPSDALGAGEVGYITASIKTVADTRVGDTVTGVENPAAAAAARLPSRPAHGLLRHLPCRRRQISGLAGRAGKAEAQRRLHDLRAGKLHCPGLRLPLRLPRPAAHGDHSGASGTGIQPRPHHHRPQRRLPRHQDQRRDPCTIDNPT